MQIENNKVVSLRYIMKNATGEVMEDNASGAPFQYLHGNGNLLPLLETAIDGLSAGDKKNIFFADQQLGGLFYFDVTIEDVRAATEAELKRGTLSKAEQRNDCGPGCCC